MNPESQYCTIIKQPESLKILREISKIGFTLETAPYRSETIKQKIQKSKQEREEKQEEKIESGLNELKQRNNDLFYIHQDDILGGSIKDAANKIKNDDRRSELSQKVRVSIWTKGKIKTQDLSKAAKDALRDYQIQGLITYERDLIKITPKGARILAQGVLYEILERLRKKGIGPHPISDIGFGSQVGTFTRPYEPGDDYELIDIEGTLMNAIERGYSPIRLQASDFKIHETLHQSKMCNGLAIDISGSMGMNYKIDAAIDTALALSEIIRTEYPRDSLYVYLFSDKWERISPYDIVNIESFGGCTDIRSPMKAFRKDVSGEEGDKQFYLLTDTEPNTETDENGNARYIGFDRATEGVISEAKCFKNDGIVLNIIMLDKDPALKRFARIVAQNNVGRVFYTSPQNLSDVLMEDYLLSKKERLRRYG